MLGDMESVDTEFYNSVKYILDNDPEPLCLYFTASREFLGQVRGEGGEEGGREEEEGGEEGRGGREGGRGGGRREEEEEGEGRAEEEDGRREEEEEGGGGEGKEFCDLYHVDSETTRLTRLLMHTPEKLRARYCYWSVYESTSSSILTLT